jgi:hypothetical protein
MAILSIQHPVADYDAWKQVFDSDPVGRKPHGVIRHWIYQDADDPKYVETNLKFVSVEEARKFLHEPALQAHDITTMWSVPARTAVTLTYPATNPLSPCVLRATKAWPADVNTWAVLRA